jgi:uncharacterized membrane protein
VKPSRRSAPRQQLAGLDRRTVDRLAGKEGVPLPTLVEDLCRDLGYTKDKVTEELMRLRAKKMITLTERVPYASLGTYALSPESMWFWAAVGVTLLSVATTLATSGLAIYLRYAFGGVFVLFLPGYALLEALYPKRDLDELTRFALSIGLSLALVPLAGLVLNYTPLGLKLLPVTLTLAGLTLALLVFALTKKHEYYRLAKGIP